MIGLMICCILFGFPTRDATFDGEQIHGIGVSVAVGVSVSVAVAVSFSSLGSLAGGPNTIGSIRSIFLLTFLFV